MNTHKLHGNTHGTKRLAIGRLIMHVIAGALILQHNFKFILSLNLAPGCIYSDIKTTITSKGV